jgi:hypothetical protein
MEQKFCPFNTVPVISCFQKEVIYLFQESASSFLCWLCSQIRYQGSFKDSWGVLKSCRGWVHVNCCCPRTGGPLIGKQRWVGSQVPTGYRRMNLLSLNMRSRLLLLVSGPTKCTGVGSGLWEAYENLSSSQLYPTISKLSLAHPQLHKGARCKMQNSCFS